MSSYLLLRNNKESGPFTIDEIKGMSLKAFDLIWVVGKSAAWRYPGEISDLKSFAPPVPEQFTDYFRKKPNTDNPAPDLGIKKNADSANPRSRENNNQRVNASKSVYVNLPVEKKSTGIPPVRVLHDAGLISSGTEEPPNDFSELYKKQPTRTVHYSGKVLWVSTILLLFGAGILTGFFISDRRNFFSTDAIPPQNRSDLQPTVLNNNKEPAPEVSKTHPENKAGEETSLSIDSLKAANPASKKLKPVSGKKNLKNNEVKKDSVFDQNPMLNTLRLNDSLKQIAISRSEALYQRIKAHPENYVNLVTGRYSTGIFGGISSFPVTVSNNSPVKMDLVVVTIEYVQNNEKVFKTENLSFNDLEPGETVTIKAPKSSRGTKIATHIHVVNAHQPDLSSSN
jgi:hypothetical protein